MNLVQKDFSYSEYYEEQREFTGSIKRANKIKKGEWLANTAMKDPDINYRYIDDRSSVIDIKKNFNRVKSDFSNRKVSIPATKPSDALRSMGRSYILRYDPLESKVKGDLKSYYHPAFLKIDKQASELRRKQTKSPLAKLDNIAKTKTVIKQNEKPIKSIIRKSESSRLNSRLRKGTSSLLKLSKAIR